MTDTYGRDSKIESRVSRALSYLLVSFSSSDHDALLLFDTEPAERRPPRSVGMNDDLIAKEASPSLSATTRSGLKQCRAR
mmetsp:Transcript_5442/g.12330  ORF Transcript_5442/g.12330 Transcript_5442/m.12330 type:complete len:80 (+) Transcript_5442:85-324(+)